VTGSVNYATSLYHTTGSVLHALEVCNLDKRILQSLDFTENGFLMKLFRTSNIEILHYC